mmetsp:Transcript_54208/g.100169  ORF Transcript_54208/g.100169 Transcript_54208/m.100169 type:complete len:243 (-) Transcript_54208:44-772(-)
MAFERDLGHACLCLPLKLAVGIITMYVCTIALVCLLALVTSNVMFQPGGYYPFASLVANCVGAAGLFFGFFGLMGVYDDKLPLVRSFVYYLFLRFAVQIAVFCLDYWQLRGCEALSDPVGYVRNNPLRDLKDQGLCQQGRNSYLFGFIIDFWVNAYCLYTCYSYLWYLEVNPPYSIDFGMEKYDKYARWDLYKVRQNPFYAEQLAQLEGESRPLVEEAPDYKNIDYLSDPMQGVGKTYGYAK